MDSFEGRHESIKSRESLLDKRLTTEEECNRWFNSLKPKTKIHLANVTLLRIQSRMHKDLLKLNKDLKMPPEFEKAEKENLTFMDDMIKAFESA